MKEKVIAPKFLKMLNVNKIKYVIIDHSGPGGGWPEIKFEGTFEQLLPVFEANCPSGYSIDELRSNLLNNMYLLSTK